MVIETSRRQGPRRILPIGTWKAAKTASSTDINSERVKETKQMKQTMIIRLMTAAGLLIQGAFGANLVKNGGFEKPLAPAGSYRCFNTGQSFGGWTVVGTPGNVCITSGTYTFNGSTFPSEAGAQDLDLTGGTNGATGVSQNFATTPGAAYTLTFWVGNIVGGMLGPTSTVNVLVNGVQVYTATNSLGAGSTSTVWQKFTATITSLTTSTSIAFINGDPGNDNYNGLDGVSLVAQ
jgi:hypothetical protein